MSGLAGRSPRELVDLARQLEQTEPLRARAYAERASAAGAEIGDRTIEAEAIYRLASISYYGGRSDEAFNQAIDARDMAHDADAPVVEAWAIHLVGIIHSDAGNHSEALACCLEALDLYRSTDHRVTEGNILNTIATIHHSLGDTDRAISTYEAALTANQQLGRRDFDAITLANMAELRGQRGEYMLAVSLGEHALQLAREHERSCIPDVLTILGRAYAGLGDPGRASSLFEEALQLADHNEQSGSEPGNGARVSAHLARGAMALSSGDYDAARTDLSEALELSQRARSRTQQLEAHEGLAQLHKALGEFEQALGHQEARYSVNQELFNEGADLRIKTLQVIHDTEATRQQAEILRLRTTELEELVQGRTRELEAFQLEALQRLAILGEFRDTDTGEHTVRVGDLSAELAMHLQLDEQYIERLRLAARLHDIGKVGIPDNILLKPGPLTAEEFEVMKTHTTIGARILAGSKSPLVRLAEEVALNHHERWDGAGYPTGFRGGAIPLSGRIVTVADVFDALTSARPYKRAWSVVDSAQYIVRASGSQFDPMVVAAFIRIMALRHPEVDLTSLHHAVA